MDAVGEQLYMPGKYRKTHYRGKPTRWFAALKRKEAKIELRQENSAPFMLGALRRKWN